MSAPKLMMALPQAWTSWGDNITPPLLEGWQQNASTFSLEFQHRPWWANMVLILVHFKLMGMDSFMASKTWCTREASMAAILAFALCAFGNKTILHRGWFGTQNNMLLLVAPFLQVFLTMVLVTCLAGAFVEAAPGPEDFKYIRNIQHCFYAQKHNIALSASTFIALSASYTQDEVTSLNKLHMEHVDCFPIPCNSLCHSKIYVIYIYPKAPHILGY